MKRFGVMMRKRKVFRNALAGLLLQLINTIFGFVFPRLVLTYYGSEINGLLQSITQFLSYIALLDAGVSAVVRAKLYKPLADNDTQCIQEIVNSAKQFYKKIAFTFVLYLFVVSFVLPFTYANYFGRMFTFSLVIIIGVSSFAEYFIGISYTVLLEADQSKYIVYIIQSVAVVLNILLSYVFIKSGASIHLVKIITSVIFIVRPLVLALYCNKKFHFDRHNHNSVTIENKWAGLGHHIAYFLHSHTDVVVLTFFKGPLLVSVYSVYNMIVVALQSMLFYISGGVEAAFGNMIAKEEKEQLSNGLRIYEVVIYSFTTVFFTTANVTIVDFVKLYTKGVTDVNYLLPVSATILIIAEAIYCIRRPYEAIVMASGKLKETMSGAFIEAGINITVSLVLVQRFGIAGVACGTLAAMMFRTIQYMNYIRKFIIKRSAMRYVKLLTTYAISAIVICFLSSFITITTDSYISWVFKAGLVLMMSCLVVLINDVLFFMEDTKRFFEMGKTLIFKH